MHFLFFWCHSPCCDPCTHMHAHIHPHTPLVKTPCCPVLNNARISQWVPSIHCLPTNLSLWQLRTNQIYDLCIFFSSPLAGLLAKVGDGGNSNMQQLSMNMCAYMRKTERVREWASLSWVCMCITA